MADNALLDSLLQTPIAGGPAPTPAPTPAPQQEAGVVSAEEVAQLIQGGAQVTPPAGDVVPAEEVAQFNEEPGLLSELGQDVAQFTTGVSEDADRRVVDFTEIANDLITGKIGAARATLDLVGKVGIGFAADLIGQTLGLVGRGIAEVAGAVIPEEIKQPIIDVSAELAEKLLETEVAQAGIAAANEGIMEYLIWSEDNPLVARDLESVGNIAALLPPARFSLPVLRGLTVIPRAASKQTIGRLGENRLAAGVAQETKLTEKFLNNFVTPVQTAKSKAAAIRQTTESKGLFGGRTVELDAGQKSRMEAVRNVPGVQRGQSNLEVTRLVETEVFGEADRLKTALVKNNVRIKPSETRRALNEAQKRLSDKLLLVGDAEKTAQRALKKMGQFASKQPPTASGLLQARKNFDKWVRDQRPNFFDKAGENSVQAAVKEIRGTVNNLINEKVGLANIGLDVKASLRKQSDLLEAADVGFGKSISEGNSKLTRIMRNISDKIPIIRDQRTRDTLAVFGAPAALTLTGASFGIPTALAVVASGGLLGGAFAATRPAVKKALGSMLKAVDDTIQKTTDPALLAKLRADRISVIEMIDNAGAEEQEPSG